MLLHRERPVELGADVRERAPDRAQHADREDVDLEQAERVEVVLVPLDDAAVGHRRVLDRHQLGHAALGDDEAARMLRKMARERDQLRRQLHPEPDDRRLGIEAALAQPLGRDAAAVEPVLALRHRLDPLQVQPQRAADVAQRRAGPVADDDRGERGAVPAVLPVDVLDHLLAPLVLEVDVDVGRLVALDADEAAEEERRAARVDLGDEEAVADERVGGAAAPLAEDFLRARPRDDVGDGEEVRLVLQLGDDGELALDRLPVFVGQAVGEALRDAGLDELAQPRRRRLARGNDLLRVFVLQLAEREAAAAGEDHRVLEPLGLVERGEAPARAQVLLGVGREREAAFGDGLREARRGERVLQRLSRAHVHQHVAGGDDRQRSELRDADDGVDELVVAGAVQQLEGDRGAVLEPGLQPHRVREDVLERLPGLMARGAPGTRAGRRASARSAPCPRHRRDARRSSPSRRAGARP